MLNKGADHIKYLRAERNSLKEKMDGLRHERDSLNNSLTYVQIKSQSKKTAEHA